MDPSRPMETQPGPARGSTGATLETHLHADEGVEPPGGQMPVLEIARPWLTPTLYLLGVLIPGAVVADWLTDFDFVTSGDDPMFATVIFTMALILLVAPGAFEATTTAYRRIWERGIIAGVDDTEHRRLLGTTGLSRATGGSPGDRYGSFLRAFNTRVESAWQWVIGAGFLVLAYLVIWDEVIRDTGDRSFLWFEGYARTHSNLELGVVLAQLVVWGLVGVVAWKVMVIAWETARLSKSFRFDVIVGHPDRSGGLAVLGQMCFRLALIVTVPSLLCALWVVVLDNEAPSGLFRERYETFAPNFRLALAVLLVLTYLVAIRPVFGVHRGMKRSRVDVQAWLDRISKRLKGQTRALLESAADLDPAEIEERRELVEADRGLVSDYRLPPTWPFDRATVLKLSASQVVPVLSLLGIAGPIAEAVENLVAAIAG